MTAMAQRAAVVAAAGIAGYALAKALPAASAGGKPEQIRPTESVDPAGDAALFDTFQRWREMDALQVEAEYLAAQERGEMAFARVLLARFVELDAQAALAANMNDPAPVFAIWARIDPDAAEAELRRNWETIRSEAAPALMRELVEQDPERVLTLARDLGLGENELSSVFARWAGTDVEAATAAAMAYCEATNGFADTDYIEGIMDELVRKDPLSALEWFDRLPKEWADFEEFCDRWAWNDHASAIAALGAGLVTDPKRAAALAAEVLDEVPERLSWRQARQLYMDYPMREESLGALAEVFSGPELAALVDAKPPADGFDDDDIESIVENWAKGDPAAAAAWALVERPGVDSGYMLGRATVIWAESAPREAMQFLAQHSSHFDDSDDAWEAVEMLLEEGVPVADGVAVLATFPPGHQPEVTSGLVQHWAGQEPEAAAEFALEVGSDEVMSSLALGWHGSIEGAEVKVEAAAEWFRARAEEGVGLAGMRSFADRWVTEDAGGASRWIAGLEHGAVRDVAVMELAQRLQRTDPEAAYRWAITIGEIEGAQELVDESWGVWSEFDPQGAADFEAETGE